MDIGENRLSFFPAPGDAISIMIFGIDHGTWTETLESGIMAIDISDPQNPLLIADYLAMEDASSIFGVDDLVFSTDTTRGMSVFSLGNPEEAK